MCRVMGNELIPPIRSNNAALDALNDDYKSPPTPS